MTTDTPVAIGDVSPRLREAPLATALREQLGEKLQECIHCGFCLPECPTYATLGAEMDSPRGRIHLVRAMADGRLPATATVHRHLDRCLDCRACVTACPSGVDYGSIIEGAREVLERDRPRPRWLRLLRWFVFRWLLPHRHRLAAVAWLLRTWQRSGLQAAARGLGLLRLAPARLRWMEQLAPRIDSPAFSRTAPPLIRAGGERRGRVALLAGCIMDHTLAGVHHATARVLARQGFDVVTPRAQTCCGALHVHNGDADTARELARRNLDAFELAEVDAIVINSSGCGAQLREYPHLLAAEPRLAERARRLAAITLDLSSFLVRAGVRPWPQPSPGWRPLRVAWDAPCHLLHAQGVRDEPLELLRAIPGVQLVPLTEAEWCCGSAGIYNITQPRLSQQILARKIAHVRAAAPDVLVTANPGCQLQLRAGCRAAGLPVRVLHLAELLDLAGRARLV